MLKKVRALFEVNPMLGHRGVRLGLTYPEIYSMQIRAVLEAAAECQKAGVEVHPEIMVPQVCTAEELRKVKSWVEEIRADVEASHKVKLNFKFGSMLEVVRALHARRAPRRTGRVLLLRHQRPDPGDLLFLARRRRKQVPADVQPEQDLAGQSFEVLDQKGVGKLMQLAIDWGRATRPDMKVGICGEHGGHPASIAFCHRIGLSYVSCSGPRVPIARWRRPGGAGRQQCRPASALTSYYRDPGSHHVRIRRAGT
jgi:pyruvate,orthophosphate dikinase